MADKVTLEFDFHAAKALQDIQKSKKEITELTESWSKASDAERKAAHQASQAAPWKLLTTDISKLGDVLESTHPKFKEVAKGLATVGAGVTAALVGISALAVQLARAAGEHESHARAVTMLGGAYESVQAATHDTIAAQDALRLQQGLVQSGLQVSGEQLGQLAQRSREFALATGTNTTQALDQMLDAMRGLESEGLRRFGVTLEATGDRQRDFNAAVNNAANAQRIAEAESRKWGTALTGVAEAQSRLASSMSGSQRTMTEEVQHTSRAFSEMTSGIAAAVARALSLQQAFSFLASDVIPTLFDSIGSQNRAQRETDVSISNRRLAERTQDRQSAQAALRTLQSSGRITEEQFEEYNSSLSTRNASREDFIRVQEYARRAGQERAPVAQLLMGDVMNPFVSQRRAEREQERRAEQLRVDSAEMTAAGERKARRAETQMAAAGNAAELLAEQLDKAKVRAAGGLSEFGEALSRVSALVGSGAARTGLQSMRSVLGLQSPNDEERAELFGGIADAQAGGGIARREADARRQRLSARDRETRRQALAQGGGVGGAVSRGLGVTGDLLETQAKITDGYANTIVGAFGKIGDALTRHIELVASGQETIGQAMLNGVHEVTKALAMEALPKSLMELAAGWAALGNPLTAVTAPAHFTAAAIYGTVAAGAGLVAGVTGALGAGQTQGAGASATGNGRVASGASSPRANESAAPVTIVLSSLVPPGPGELQRLVDAGSQAGRYNLDRRRDMLPRQVRA